MVTTMVSTQATSHLDHEVLRILTRAAYRIAVNQHLAAELHPEEEISEVPDQVFEHFLAQLPYRKLAPSLEKRKAILRQETMPFIDDILSLEDRATQILDVLKGYYNTKSHGGIVSSINWDGYLKDATNLNLGQLTRDPLVTPHGIFIPLPSHAYSTLLDIFNLVDTPIVLVPAEHYTLDDLGTSSHGLCYLVKDEGTDDISGDSNTYAESFASQEGSTAFFNRVQLGVGLAFQRMPKLPVPKSYATASLDAQTKKLWRRVLQAERRLYQHLVAYVMVEGKYAVAKLMEDNSIPNQRLNPQESLQDYFTNLVSNGSLDHGLAGYISNLSDAIPKLCDQIAQSRAKPKVKAIVLYDDQSFINQAECYRHRLTRVSDALRQRQFSEVKQALNSLEYIF